MRKKIFLLLIPVFIIVLTQFTISNIKLLRFPAQDFEVFYLAGKYALNNENPYQKITGKDPFKNPPPALLVFTPLAILPILQSQILWFLLSITSFLIASFFLFRIVNWKGWKIWLIFLTASLLFFPMRYNLGSGQINNFLFLLIVLSFYYLKTNSILSPLGLASAIALRVTPIFFLLTLFLQSRIRLISKTFLGLLSLSIISLIFFGPHIFSNYLTAGGTYFDFGISAYYNQSLAGFLSRTIQYPQINWIIILTSLTLALIHLIRQTRVISKNPLKDIVIWSISILYILIFAPYTWQYNFVIVIFSLIATCYLSQKLKLSSVFFFFVGLSYLLIGANIKNPTIFSGFFGGIILSHVLIGTLILLFLNLYILKKLSKT